MIDPSLSGMTVNERLVYAGTFGEWNIAAQRRDRETMIRLLVEVEVNNPEQTVDTMLANPSKYGF